MPFPVLGSNSAVAGYEIDNSLRFNDDDSPKLQQTFSSAGNQKTNTFSCWFKLANLGSLRYIFANNENDSISFDTNDNLLIELGGAANGYLFFTNQKWRDVSAWYHLVFVLDTTNATAGNRMKVYLNGEDITSTAAASSNPSLNLDTGLAKNIKHGIGYRSANDDRYFDGYISEVYFIDGSAKAPTDFGETNDNGVWIPKTYSGSYGTNGFFLEFKNSGSLGTDTSGNGNNFTPSGLGTYSQGTDTPTNNFCTLNPLAQNPNLSLGLAHGNTQSFDTNNGSFRPCGATMCFTKGKWYFETKFSGSNALMVGLFDADNSTAQAIWSGTGDRFAGYNSGGNGFSYRNNGTLYTNGNTTSGKTSWSNNGDFLGLAIDCDNNAIYAHVNGTYVDSGDPTSGASKTGSLSNFAQTGFMMPMISVSAAGFNGGYHNFGNPVNNDSGVTNSNTDANGYGQFQYAVPSGYYALCTKNLAEFG